MGRPFLESLDGRVYACRSCKTHLATAEAVASRTFRSRNGIAYLLDEASNVSCGASEDRQMLTGKHTVRDIHCAKCCRVVGWRYEHAFEPSQKYKEGKFILERAKVKRDGAKWISKRKRKRIQESDEDDDD
ncbi:yippee family protein [bacterium]|nr:yippee family protein [bacterium]|tara:strand:- start:7644 stop:8036 length:393 start_codon:yes stop_codon:yes gene_type:complete